MKARIFKPCKSVTQSGTASTKNWLLTFIHDGSRQIYDIIGWVSSEDTMGTEVKIPFMSKEAAVSFAEKNGIEYEIYDPETTSHKKKSYTSNFL